METLNSKLCETDEVENLKHKKEEDLHLLGLNPCGCLKLSLGQGAGHYWSIDSPWNGLDAAEPNPASLTLGNKQPLFVVFEKS